METKRKTRIGFVLSRKMDKTAIVGVEVVNATLFTGRLFGGL